jgi:hypothetical protein
VTTHDAGAADGAIAHTEPMEALTRGDVLSRIVERADLELFTDRVLDSFWEQGAFQELHPERDHVRAWVRWNLDLVIRWLIHGEPSERGGDRGR